MPARPVPVRGRRHHMRDSFTGGWAARELAARPWRHSAKRLRRGRIRAASPLRAAMNEPRPTILIVEDDRHTRAFLADNLAADGFEPIGAANAKEAVRMME